MPPGPAPLPAGYETNVSMSARSRHSIREIIKEILEGQCVCVRACVCVLGEGARFYFEVQASVEASVQALIRY